MKHNQSPEAIIVGLYEVGWRNEEYCLGLSSVFESVNIDQQKLTDRGRQTIRATKSLAKFTRKGTRDRMELMRAAIVEYRWNTSVPLDQNHHADPAVTTLVGLTGDGACADCLKKPTIAPRFGKTLKTLVPQVVNSVWHNYLLHEAYREQQLSVLRKAAFFDTREGLRAESILKSCGGALQEGLLCVCKPVDNYLIVTGKGGVGQDKIIAEAMLNRGVPEITDVQHDREWCPTCESQVVKLNHDLFKLIRG